MEFEHLQLDGKVLYNVLLQIPPFPPCLKEDTNGYNKSPLKRIFKVSGRWLQHHWASAPGDEVTAAKTPPLSFGRPSFGASLTEREW